MKKILVIQFSVDQAREHGQICLKEVCADANLTFVNAIEENVSLINLDGFDGIILGGSGQFYLSQGDGKETWLPQVFVFLDRVFSRNIPTIGICFGSQILALHQGAVVVQDETMGESGTLANFLLPEAARDELFTDLPPSFMANFAHKDTPVNLPGNLIPLSRSEKVVCTAFRIENKKIWGVLFHPELSLERMKERMRMFPNYVSVADDSQSYADQVLRQTPESNRILASFVRQI